MDLLKQITAVQADAVSCPACAPKENAEKEIVPMNTNPKLYVLTGFLGSGKTTLLLKILENL